MLSIAQLQRRIDRLSRACAEERRRTANPLQVRVWLPAKDGIDYEPLPHDTGAGVLIYIIRDSDKEAFDAWEREHEHQ